jgi:hypothetical protein
MNGVAAVSLGSGWLSAPNFVEVATAGSTFGNVGTINVQVASGGAVQSTMLPPHASANQLRYRVPAGKVAYVVQETFGSMGDTEVQTAIAGTTTSTLPLLSTGMLGFVYKASSIATIVGVQKKRFFAYRGIQVPRDYGWTYKLNALDIYAPSVQNTTAKTVEFTGEVTILEEDAPV